MKPACLTKLISASYFSLLVSWAIVVCCPYSWAQTPTMPPSERIAAAQKEVEDNPKDTGKRFQLADTLRIAGEPKKAAIEYLDVTALDPGYYIAYHNLLRCKPTADQLDEALDRLKKLEEDKPKSLMLRVALSEVLEKKGDFYTAARTLVDLQYAHAIPEKYLPKVNSRIHFLLTRAKDIRAMEKAKTAVQEADEEMDTVPLPLPDSSLSKGFSSSQLKENKVPDNYGHARIAP